jgi:hypothetical protein
MRPFAYEADPVGSDRWNLCPDAVSTALHRARRLGKTTEKVSIGGNAYTIDLDAMTQTNMRTRVRRRLKLVEGVEMYAFDSSGEWHFCDDETNAAISRACASGDANFNVKIGEYMYAFDMAALTQTNVASGHVRQLRRERCAAFAFEDGAPRSGRWKLCDNQTCMQLSRAQKRRQRTVRHAIGTHEYVFDLVAMTQTNSRTGAKRSLRIISADSTSTAAHAMLAWLRRVAHPLLLVCAAAMPVVRRKELTARACCGYPLQRHSWAIMATTVLWFATVVVASSASASLRLTPMLVAYGNSISLVACVVQMFSGAAASKLAICRVHSADDQLLAAPHIRKINSVCATLLAAGSLLTYLEGQGTIGSLVDSAELHAERLAAAAEADAAPQAANSSAGGGGVAVPPSVYAAVNSVASLNLAVRAQLVIRRGPVVEHEASDGPPPDIVVVSDGVRMTLDAQERPTDDMSYVMYHGTHPHIASTIEEYGFIPSRDGMPLEPEPEPES